MSQVDPPVEVGREGDDAVVRLELPGVDIAEDTGRPRTEDFPA